MSRCSVKLGTMSEAEIAKKGQKHSGRRLARVWGEEYNVLIPALSCCLCISSKMLHGPLRPARCPFQSCATGAILQSEDQQAVLTLAVFFVSHMTDDALRVCLLRLMWTVRVKIINLYTKNPFIARSEVHSKLWEKGACHASRKTSKRGVKDSLRDTEFRACHTKRRCIAVKRAVTLLQGQTCRSSVLLAVARSSIRTVAKEIDASSLWE